VNIFRRLVVWIYNHITKYDKPQGYALKARRISDGVWETLDAHSETVDTLVDAARHSVTTGGYQDVIVCQKRIGHDALDGDYDYELTVWKNGRWV
jgi:hypothetical protein